MQNFTLSFVILKFLFFFVQSLVQSNFNKFYSKKIFDQTNTFSTCYTQVIDFTILKANFVFSKKNFRA